MSGARVGDAPNFRGELLLTDTAGAALPFIKTYVRIKKQLYEYFNGVPTIAGLPLSIFTQQE
jgi:hypothetical protein